MQQDHYATLGVGPDASADEIKTIYRKLARQWHPDVNKSPEAEEKFKAISAAYDILGDPDRRAEYDRQRNAPPMPDFNGFHFVQTPFHQRPPAVNINQPKRITIFLKPEETLEHQERTIRYERNIFCATCKGEGGTETDKQICPDCRGAGWVTIRQQHGMMMIQQTMPCGRCQQRGHTFVKLCDDCQGFRTKPETVEKQVRIPKGSVGKQFMIANLGGHETPLFPPAPLYVYVGVEETPGLEFALHNVLMTVDIDPVLALLGGEVELPYFDGERLTVIVPRGCRTGHRETIQGRGIPRDENSRGNLVVTLALTPPDEVTEEQEAFLRAYLATKQGAKENKEELVKSNDD